MSWKDVGQKVAEVGFPLLGRALGSTVGAGGIGEQAGRWLAEKFGVDFGAADAPAQVLAALNADPETVLKLTQIQLDHAEEMARIDLSRDQAYLVDRQDARKREVSVTQATGRRDWFQYALAAAVIVFYALVTGVLLFVKLDPETSKLAGIAFGYLGSGFTIVLAYYFGSSKGSSDKTQMMAGGSRTAPTT